MYICKGCDSVYVCKESRSRQVRLVYTSYIVHLLQTFISYYYVLQDDRRCTVNDLFFDIQVRTSRYFITELW